MSSQFRDSSYISDGVNLDADLAPFIHHFDCDLSSALTDLEASQFTFPDDHTLDVPVLNVLRAGSQLASIFGCADMIWNPTSIWTLHPDSQRSLSLTPNFEPTAAQLTIPHHPIFDLLPWPSVRTKLITIFSLPSDARPTIARGPMALMQLMYDLDDTSEGLRVSGYDWRLDSSWEVGQKAFENWWFAFDGDVLRQSNLLREKRGATKLLPPTTQDSLG
ncbi:Uncharacterized protein PECH_001343 [Penicillium ucsense]|uniref:Uncharacterized protein n=1 Tax=Penicillium ucsense TaxID=2839758 RepID=A0A8J8VYY9_9EURO|nr:Uncharacterized protein PECM_001230 [Penicillium ucsense]KAF7732973.1 Uncharacterized protein PECH_001343 [Penicillium ucsense]